MEVLGRVSGRLAPFTVADAGEMIAEFDDLGVLDGVARPAAPGTAMRLPRSWSRPARLAAARPGLDRHLRHQPAGLRPDGFAAVDGLCLLRE